MFDQALVANPEPNATWFDLDHLNRHNILEHDASLSRSDAYFGNNHLFNQTIFDESRKYWTGPVIDSAMLGNSKIARQLQSKSTNPTYTCTDAVEHFSLGEILAPVIALGDIESATVQKNLVEYFFESERLPTHLGWSKRSEPVMLADILRLLKIFSKASSLLTKPLESASRKEDIHVPPMVD
ncbi:hypothetical protein LTR37_014600 [Vermiconidia calcicola]|uniref:Uncharacterized protein n=1 Tax=Vermiconidia calcicola TaxID=1690605 RepID=A0ACC3MU23_9PEZI|nr:hypothetical protein LTR37_014600 [Vermiconidia calcicola]